MKKRTKSDDERPNRLTNKMNPPIGTVVAKRFQEWNGWTGCWETVCRLDLEKNFDISENSSLNKDCVWRVTEEIVVQKSKP